MTDKPELQHDAAQAGFANAVVLGLAAYVVFPVLALITAVMGLVLILNDRLVPGLIFLAVILQAWVVAGLWTHFRRTKILNRDTRVVERQTREEREERES
ncbi:NF038396 family protein [Nesterenkonia cremea]|uniref:Uncharacterized protein n=1 Tax=Nesterenkonia cremea TaxID=1882340 RepID=A0A917ER81_9MICC|nr:NF038396 family protein [Nesterenkonia cremea]GGE69217.1 hypothetical protein GCM10011401_15720 [Nesterenkonia cremea]